ncbi:MAG TPA: sugar phosphate nucleotidyltransferase [Patescibacteria group bacterium]|nr:sugar phosphate nucleotidyltransferase [Patescibacteria group bacterium]
MTRPADSSSAHAVILAGGRGTRFWPRSRLRTPKQLLNIVGSSTMFEQTVQRLLPVFSWRRLWCVTNAEQSAAIRKLARRIPPAHILSEPVGRNTAAAIALAAFHLVHGDQDALMAVLPSDHFIRDLPRYHDIVDAALDVAARGPNLVVLGIPPTHPETGYGYIERSSSWSSTSSISPTSVFAVSRFTEKPDASTARQFLSSGDYYWNAGMFFWRARTYLDCLKRYLPSTHAALARVAETIGTRRYASALARAYQRLENISVDYAILERATREPGAAGVYVLPADIGWSDIGSWAAVYDLLASAPGANVARVPLCAIDASGNYVWSSKKLVALLGVSDLVVVETPDALLICPRSRAQDVSKLVKSLESPRRRDLL